MFEAQIQSEISVKGLQGDKHTITQKMAQYLHVNSYYIDIGLKVDTFYTKHSALLPPHSLS
jgi:hypothetical protein